MLEEGISYPLAGDSALGRIVIGGFLGLFSFLILPGIALFGYFVRVLESSASGQEEPPPFEDWGGLMADGLKGIAVSVVYAIVPFLLLFVMVGLTGAGLASGGDSGGGFLAAFGVLGTLVSFLVVLVMYYLIPAALTNMAVEGRVGAGFDFATLKPVLLSLDYLLAWLLPVVIAILVNIVSVVIVAVTFGIGALVLPFIQFYFQVSIFYMFGRAFGSVVEGGDGTEVEGTGVPAA